LNLLHQLPGEIAGRRREVVERLPMGVRAEMGLVAEGQATQNGSTYEEVIALIAKIKHEQPPKQYDGRNPYPGLAPFDESDAPFFFGREASVQRLLSRIRDMSEPGQPRFLCVTGASGSGKSSLVRAGLVPALRQGTLDGSADWHYTDFSPQTDPLMQLSYALARLTGLNSTGEQFLKKYSTDPNALSEVVAPVMATHSQRAVIFIDQFEELFTHTKDSAARVAFVTQLTRAAQQINGRIIVVLSVRSDFLSSCFDFPELSALLRDSLEQVTRMSPSELTRAIVHPALEVGLRIDPNLVVQIISEMSGEPNALPQMQHTLHELTRRVGETAELTLSDYLNLGGIYHAIQIQADSVIARLSPDQQALARDIFTQLISIGRGTVDTRRTVLMEQLGLAGQPAEPIESLVQTLTDARLLTTSAAMGGEDRTVTIAHESLLVGWPWLAQLITEYREVISLQNEIVDDAAKWMANGQDVSYLYRGTRLSHVVEAITSSPLSLSNLSRTFIDTAVAEEKRTSTSLRSRATKTINRLFGGSPRKPDEDLDESNESKKPGRKLGGWGNK
jgi:energy-coupling factor transporter ATP-binding protein EcfA2